MRKRGRTMVTLNVDVDVPRKDNQYVGTETEKNLWRAFIAESMARNRYTFYASAARKEGMFQIANILEHVANNEKEHAEIWFKKLCQLYETPENLIMAALGEHEEWTKTYAEMSMVAAEEGYCALAYLFREVAKIEKTHESKFNRLSEQLKKDGLYKKNEATIWECSNCGHIEIAADAPEICPVCGHPIGYFEDIKAI